MGIPGLTTFIAKSSHQYLKQYELHDTYLVIDGNNIASHLYKWHCVKNDCFGGDYDKYGNTIYHFFDILKDCNITPLVIFDGGFEKRKLRTIFGRMRDKVKMAKRLNSMTEGTVGLFPLFLRDLFVDIVIKLKLKVARCEFEADYEMACLARDLNCPLLSYDSDFYVFDVCYIPFSSIEMCHYKVKNSLPPQYRMQCQLYKIENFLKRYGGLNRENLPLIATLLGNDYISKSVFKNFYAHIKLPKRKHLLSEQQRQISSVIKWLQNETYESAVKKILCRLKTEHRNYVAKQIKAITDGYTCDTSKLLSCLNVSLEISKAVIVQVEDATALLNDFIGTECEISSDEDTSDSDSTQLLDLNLADLDKSTYIEEEDDTWFLSNYKKCCYPAIFMDIRVRNTYFCAPQIEDYANVCSHEISQPILSALNKILSRDSEKTLTCIMRSEHGSVRKYNISACTKELPTIMDLKDWNVEKLKALMYSILEIKTEIINLLNTLPSSWRLYILGIVYWIKSSNSGVKYYHVYALILCALVINKIDNQLGFYRSTCKFANKFKVKLQQESASCESSDQCDSGYQELLSNFSYTDCLFCMNELVKYFEMEEKMRSHLKLFNVHILDCFAQFQSCLLHITYLNKLLNKPFEDILISEFYDGTFIYNMSVNLSKRNDIDAYLSSLLKNCRRVYACCKSLVGLLTEMTSDCVKSSARKQRRKKKKCKVVTNELQISPEKQSDEEDLIDMNNRFSLLNLVKST